MSQTRALFRRYPRLRLWQRLFMASRLLILPLRVLDAALPRAGRILDLGSGRGVLANWLSLAAPGRVVVGVELAGERVRTAASSARSGAGVRFLHGDIRDLGGLRLPGPFDAVLISEVLYLLGPEDQERVLRGARDLLALSGALVVLDYDRRPRWKFVVFFFETAALHGALALVRAVVRLIPHSWRRRISGKLTDAFGCRRPFPTLRPAAEYCRMLEQLDLVVRVEHPSGWVYPHVLLIARPRPACTPSAAPAGPGRRQAGCNRSGDGGSPIAHWLGSAGRPSMG